MKPTFGYTPVSLEQTSILSDLNDHFTSLETRIKKFVPAGRRQSLALTHLEESAMWASKAIAKEVE
jgi:hypothetical protein